jgi:hypothetical protein
MTVTDRFNSAVIVWATLLAFSCRYGNNPRILTEVIRQADRVVLYEGLPHPAWESNLLEEERRNKAIQELDGYPFYQEVLTLTPEDAKRLSEVLGESATYMPFAGDKLCGGFHPDYAAEWHVGEDRYRALICFGCEEVKLFGPRLDSRNDLDHAAYEKIQELLKGYRKNRPRREEPRAEARNAEPMWHGRRTLAPTGRHRCAAPHG